MGLEAHTPAACVERGLGHLRVCTLSLSSPEPVEIWGFVLWALGEVFHFLVIDDCWVLKYMGFSFYGLPGDVSSGKKKNLNNVSFLSQGGFVTSSFLQVPQG